MVGFHQIALWPSLGDYGWSSSHCDVKGYVRLQHSSRDYGWSLSHCDIKGYVRLQHCDEHQESCWIVFFSNVYITLR
jgi:hypothetical protein